VWTHSAAFFSIPRLKSESPKQPKQPQKTMTEITVTINQLTTGSKSQFAIDFDCTGEESTKLEAMYANTLGTTFRAVCDLLTERHNQQVVLEPEETETKARQIGQSVIDEMLDGTPPKS